MSRRITMFVLLLVLLAPLVVLTIWPLGSGRGGGGNGTDMLLRDGRESLITLQQAYSSVISIGGVGSGKTTSVGNLELALFSHPCRPGGVWCVVKQDECERALRILQRAGRLDDVILLGPEGPRFDVMRYMLERYSPEVLAQLLDRLGLVATHSDTTHSQGIWQQYTVVTLRYAIELLRLAGVLPNPIAAYDVIMSAPMQVLSAEPLEAWRRDSVCGQMMERAELRARNGELNEEERQLLMQSRQFFQLQLPSCGTEMGGSIRGVSVNPLTPLLFPPWSTLFGSGITNFTPEDLIEDGKIILFHPAWSVLAACAPAQLVQAMMVQVVQMACMRRKEGQDRPIVIDRDEVGHVLSGSDWDSKVLSVSRSHRMIHLSALQDVSTGISSFGGGPKAKERFLSFLANHYTKLLFSCSDEETCRMFSALLGMQKELMVNISPGQIGSMSDQGGLIDTWLGVGSQPRLNLNEQYQPNVRPELFSGGFLRTGGPHTDPPWSVDAIIYQAGRKFSSGKAFRKITFRQVL